MTQLLAIKGHITRYKEVIEILEMLGGKNEQGHNGNNPKVAYYICDDNIIRCDCVPNIYPNIYKCVDYTLEEFLEKYPYKVGDKVKNARINDFVGRIIDARWDNNEEQVIYYVEWDDETKSKLSYFAKGLQSYKEETMEEKLTTQDIRDNNAEWLLNKLQEMSSESALQTINDLYSELHKPQYPKTYEECCKVLGIDSDNFLSIRNLYRDDGDEESTDYERDLLGKFEYLWELTICRDTYWKIIGEQMGLDKPWKPVYTDDSIKYSITTHKNRLDFNGTIERNYVLIFPTKEIKNAFYENFKDLIAQCEELL